MELSMTVIALTLVTLTAAITLAFPSRRSGSRFKRIGRDSGPLYWNSRAASKEYESVGWQLAENQYQEDRGCSYVIPAIGRIILSAKYIEELWKVPENVLSHRHSFAERFMGSVTGMDVVLQSRLHSDLIRVQLTQNLEKMLPRMESELQEMQEEDSRLKTTTFEPTQIFKLASDLITRQTSLMLVGKNLCHDQEWLTVLRSYLTVLLEVMKELKAWPAFVRPYVAPWLTSTKKLDEFDRKLFIMLEPLIQQRREGLSDQLPSMLDLLVDRCEGIESTTKSITKKLMMIALAAGSTSTLALSNALLDLCAMPQYAEALRDEISQRIKDNGSQLKMTVIQSMWRLDSFMKESHRVNQPGLFGFIRKVRAPLHLSDGTVVPAGDTISLPTGFMARDQAHFQGDFDGWRFYSQRISKGDDKPDTELQFAGVHPQMPVWGVGRSTCPGRFYAELQIKLALIMILMEYDFKFPDGQTKRPEGTVRGEFVVPPMQQTMLLRHTKA